MVILCNGTLLPFFVLSGRLSVVNVFLIILFFYQGDVNPIRDLEIIHSELAKKDLEFVTSAMTKIERVARTDKLKKAEYEILEKVKLHLEEG